MHILDVISIVSRSRKSSKCTEIIGGGCFAPETTDGGYSAPPDPLAVLRGPTLRSLLVRKEREGEVSGSKMIYAPRVATAFTRRTPCLPVGSDSSMR